VGAVKARLALHTYGECLATWLEALPMIRSEGLQHCTHQQLQHCQQCSHRWLGHQHSQQTRAAQHQQGWQACSCWALAMAQGWGLVWGLVTWVLVQEMGRQVQGWVMAQPGQRQGRTPV
jgi:hypothetical protein